MKITRSKKMEQEKIDELLKEGGVLDQIVESLAPRLGMSEEVRSVRKELMLGVLKSIGEDSFVDMILEQFNKDESRFKVLIQTIALLHPRGGVGNE
jgi:hypothetical protein